MSERSVPEWLTLELGANHPGIEVRWMEYGFRKTFVLPPVGDAFYRMRSQQYGVVMHRRFLTPTSPEKWQLHPRTYMPEPDCAPDGRWVVFQVNAVNGNTTKLFDNVNDDGSVLPLDMRLVHAIQVRDGKYGAQEKAIEDVEAEPARAEALATGVFEERCDDLFERMHFDISHAIGPGGAGITPDPHENDIEIVSD